MAENTRKSESGRDRKKEMGEKEYRSEMKSRTETERKEQQTGRKDHIYSLIPHLLSTYTLADA